eukprot:GGOE01058788.1.p1 GENE.GGOE01058788.1~~GGOE01058788.1.p1  ORF type:complete len:304 (-),score=99.18 GGOE01058788.1:128-991(-)
MVAPALQGVTTITTGLTLLFGLAWPLGLTQYATAALALQWAVFICHCLPFRSEKFYDASGSATHLLLIVLASLQHPLRHPRQVVCAMLATIWATRLGSFLFTRILRDGRDDRFTRLKKNTLLFAGAWTLQAVWVFIILLPVLVVNDQLLDPMANALNLVDAAGWVLWWCGFVVEVVADAQKGAFKANPANQGKFITTGLWAYSRHPNYFGEILMWCAMVAACCSSFVRPLHWLALLSPGFTAFLLLKVSGVPMLDAAAARKWGARPEYQHYMMHTSLLIPWIPAKPL